MTNEIIENNENTEIENKAEETKSGNSFKKFLIGSIVGALVGVAGTIFVKKKFVKYDDDYDIDDFDDDFDDFEDDDFEDSEKTENDK